MEPIDPKIAPSLLPQHAEEIVIAKDQPEYRPLPAVRTPSCVITRWTLSPEERAAVARGEDVYLRILTAGTIQPVDLTIGPVNWRDAEPSPTSAVTVVKTQPHTRFCLLSCGHSVKQADNLALPPVGAEVLCPVCMAEAMPVKP